MPLSHVDPGQSGVGRPPNRIRVAYLIGSLELGGTQKHLYDLIGGLDRNEFDPSLIVFQAGGVYQRKFESLNVPIHELDIRSRADLARRVPRFRRVIRMVGPDVLHSVLYLSSLYGCLVRVFDGNRRCGLVVSKRSMENDMPWLRRVAYRTVIMRCPDAITAVSPPVYHRCLALGAHHEKLRLIPNGIGPLRPLHGKLRQELGIPEAAPVIGTAGSLTRRKGQLRMVRIMPALLKESPDLYMVIMGEGPLRAELEREARQRGVAERVLLPGTLSPATDYMSDLSAFVLPSWEEGTSNALLEAMTLGIPCIASNIPSNAAVVSHLVDGLLVDAENETAFAAAVLSVLGDAPLARALADSARDTIQRRFSIDTMISDNESLYRELALGAQRQGHLVSEVGTRVVGRM